MQQYLFSQNRLCFRFAKYYNYIFMVGYNALGHIFGDLPLR